MRRAIKRVEATEELLRQLNSEETLESRITTDFPLSEAGSTFGGDGGRILTPDELKNDNPWSDPKPAPASPARSEDSDYSTIPSSCALVRKNFHYYSLV